MNDERPYKYNAFISYRHVEPDFAIAKRLHTLFEQFTVPKDLDVAQRSDFRVFRDREELPTGELGAAINSALADSEFLIVICSPRTPFSPWCRREITEFRKTHDDSKIIAVLVEGTPETSYPPELKELSTSVTSTDGEQTDVLLELLAADVRTEAAQSPDFVGYEEIEANDPARLEKETKEAFSILKKTEHQRVMATILGVTLGDLIQRQKERRLRRLITFGTIIGVALTAVAIAMTTLFFSAQRAEREAQDKSAQLQLDGAAVSLEQGDRALALAQAKDAMDSLNPSMDGYAASRSMYHGLLLDGIDYAPLSGVAHIDTGAIAPFFSQDPSGERIVTGGRGNTAVVWETKSGQPLTEIESSSPVIRAHFYGDDKITAVTPQAVEVFDALSGISLSKTDIPVARIQVSGTMMNGRYLIIVPQDYSYMIIDQDTGEVVHQDFRRNAIGRIAVNSNFPYLASVNDDGSTSVYDISTGDVLARIPMPEGVTANSLAVPNFSGDGSTLTVTTSSSVAWYSTTTWEQTDLIDGLYVFVDDAAVRVSHTGDLVGIASFNSEAPIVIDRPSANPPKPEDDTSNDYTYLSNDAVNSDVIDFQLSPDGQWSVSSHVDGTLAVFNLQNDERYSGRSYDINSRNIPRHASRPWNVNFTPDSKYIISSAEDGTISIIAVDGTSDPLYFNGRLGAGSENKLWHVTSVSAELWLHEFDDEGHFIATTQMPGVRFQDGENYSRGLYANAVSNDGKWAFVVSESGNRLGIRGTDSDIVEFEIDRPSTVVDFVQSRATTPVFDDNNTLYLPGVDGTIRSLGLDGTWGREYAVGDATIADLTIGPSEKLIAASFDNGRFVILNYETGDVVREGTGQIIGFSTIGDTARALGIDGETFFTVVDGELEEGAHIDSSFKRDLNGITIAAASSDLRYVIAEAGSSNPILVDVETGTEIKRDDVIGPPSMVADFVGQSYTYLYNYSVATSWEDYPQTVGLNIEPLEALEGRLDDIVGEREANAVQLGND